MIFIGLRRIHKGFPFVKDALSHVVTLETHEPYELIHREVRVYIHNYSVYMYNHNCTL